MASMVDALWSRATTLTTRWLSIVVLSALMLARAATVSIRLLLSVCWASARWLPTMRQQLLNPAVQLGGQPGEHVFEVGPRLVPVELGRLRRAPNYAEWACLLR